MNWSDPSFLRTASTWFQAFAICLVFLGGISQIGKLLIDRRERRISSAIAKEKEEANENEKRDLREKIVESEQRIRTLYVDTKMEISARWKNDKPPDPRKWVRVGGDGSSVSLHFTLTDDIVVPVHFDGGDGISFTQLENGHTELRYTAYAKPDERVFSLVPRKIVAVEGIEASAYGVDRVGLADLRTAIKRLHLTFYVNGRPSFYLDVIGDVASGEADNDLNQTKFTFKPRIPVVQGPDLRQ